MKTIDMQEQIAYIAKSIQRVSEQTGAPFLEVLTLFEDYAMKMVQVYYLTGGYPDFSRLLKGGLINADASEAIEPYMDYDGQNVWRCGKCGNSLMHPSYYESDGDLKNYIKYCNHCGKKVKWNN